MLPVLVRVVTLMIQVIYSQPAKVSLFFNNIQYAQWAAKAVKTTQTIAPHVTYWGHIEMMIP